MSDGKETIKAHIEAKNVAEAPVTPEETKPVVSDVSDASEAHDKAPASVPNPNDSFELKNEVHQSWADMCEEDDGTLSPPLWDDTQEAPAPVSKMAIELPVSKMPKEVPVTNVFDALPDEAKIAPKDTRRRNRPKRNIRVSSIAIEEDRAPIADSSIISVAAAGSTSSAAAGSTSSALGTLSIRVFEPTRAQIYVALAACGLIKVDNKPPDSFKNGTAAQIALYNAFYENPRGIRCRLIKDAVLACWKHTTECMYAKLIAIIYELTNHEMTKERIAAIDFYDFNNMYRELVSRTGNHWFGVYPLFENAKLHIENYSHQCDVNCPVAHVQRELHNINQRDRQTFQTFVVNHMLMYKHPAYPGPPGRGPQFGNRGPRDSRDSRDSRGPRGSRSGGQEGFGGQRREINVRNNQEQVVPQPFMFPSFSIHDSLDQANTARRRRSARNTRNDDEGQQ